jgi:hypothetical protein
MKMGTTFALALAIALFIGMGSTAFAAGDSGGGTLLFSEGFDDTDIASRGWFDGSSFNLDTSMKNSGAGCMKWTWAQGATSPTRSLTIRHDFTATEELRLSFYWRFNSDWVGSGQSYQPHLLYILSDLDNNWGALADNYLDTYIEVNNLTPGINIQDNLNINTNPTPPWATTLGTENRSVGGCNGYATGSDSGTQHSCYNSGGWYNDTEWRGTVNFVKGSWRHVEVYLKMNSIAGGIAQPDGIMQEWIDGMLTINKSNIIYRTGHHPTMKWATFVIAPYIGDGSPQTQTMWMDDLSVYNGSPSAVPGTPTASPSGDGGGGGGGGCFIDTVRHGTQTSGGRWLVPGLIAGGFALRIEN